MHLVNYDTDNTWLYGIQVIEPHYTPRNQLVYGFTYIRRAEVRCLTFGFTSEIYLTIL